MIGDLMEMRSVNVHKRNHASPRSMLGMEEVHARTCTGIRKLISNFRSAEVCSQAK